MKQHGSLIVAVSHTFRLYEFLGPSLVQGSFRLTERPKFTAPKSRHLTYGTSNYSRRQGKKEFGGVCLAGYGPRSHE